MKNLLTCLIFASCAMLAAPDARAQGATASPDDANHQELRVIKDAVLTAFNQRDYQSFLSHLHPNVVATWQNAEVSRHPEGVGAFMKKMSEGDTKQVESAQAELTADEPTIFYSDKNTGIVFGNLVQDFKFVDRADVQLKSRWTATFVRENDRWLLAAVHVSADIFENPILGIAVKKTAWSTGLGGAAVGLILGLLIGRRRKSNRTSPVLAR